MRLPPLLATALSTAIGPRSRPHHSGYGPSRRSGWPCGAGLPVVVAATAGHFLVTRRVPPPAGPTHRRRREPPTLRLSYTDGLGVLRAVNTTSTDRAWTVPGVAVDRNVVTDDGRRIAAVTLELAGRGDLAGLARAGAELIGVRHASTGREQPVDE